MKKTEELVKNTAIISIGKMGTQVVSFFLLPLYTSSIASEAYGNFDFVTTIAGFIVPIMTLLLEESMFQFLIDCKTEDNKRKIISNTFILAIGNAIIISVMIIVFTILFKYNLGFSIAAYSLAMVLIALANALSRGLGKISLYSLSNFITSVSIIMMNLILIIGFKLDFSALLLSGIVSYSLSSVFVFIKLQIWEYIKLSDLDFEQIKYMLKFSIPLVPNTISWNIINVSDRLVIMNFSGAAINGLYSIAYKFPTLINTFYNFFNIAWKETSAKIVQDNDLEYFIKIHKTIMNGMFSITILLISSLKIIYPIFINSAYSKSISYVPLLAISVYYSSMSAFYGGIITAYKDTKVLGTTSFWAAGLNLIVDLALYHFIGVYAAAISTLAASLFLYWYRRNRTQNFMPSKYRDEWYVESGFLVVLVVFYTCSKFINIILLAVCIIVACRINKIMIRGIIRMLRNIIKG